MIKDGKIVNEQTGEGIPYASIEIIDSAGLYMGAGTSTDVKGNFALDSLQMKPGTFLKVTSTGYKAAAFSFEQYSPDTATGFALLPDVVELPPVVITAIKKGIEDNKGLIYAALGLGLLWLIMKKK